LGGLRGKIQIFALLLLITGAAVLLVRYSAGSGLRRAGQNSSPGPEQKKAEAPGKNKGTSSGISGSAEEATANRRLTAAFEAVRKTQAATPGEEATLRRVMENTAEYLLGLPPREAVAAILRRLASGEDAKTEWPFEPGENGLKSWPTWRVYLLDLLGSVDPKRAADYARSNVFTRYESADEWAIAMRSVLAAAPQSAQPQARAEISALLGRMLARDEWRTLPTGGMFEAMDFVAQTPDAALHLARLQKWAAENPDGSIDTALQIAAERTATRQPGRLISALASEPSLLASTQAQRALRASIVARADLRDSGQAEAVRAFLVRLPGQGEEAAAFFALFPNHRFSVAPGLAATPSLPTAGEMRAADSAALALVADWQHDPALSIHARDLQALEEKLRRILGL